MFQSRERDSLIWKIDIVNWADLMGGFNPANGIH